MQTEQNILKSIIYTKTKLFLLTYKQVNSFAAKMNEMPLTAPRNELFEAM